MPDVFINYRTGDGDEAAVLVEKALSLCFGEEKIFRAARSIMPGDPFPQVLLRAVRRSAVLLAIIGPGWSHHPRLHDESDWVRREILEAYACGIRVVPLLKGRKTERLNAADLPADLARLADAQSLRLDIRDNATDLAHIADKLAGLVPSLKKVNQAAIRSHDESTARGPVRNTRGTVAQASEIVGDFGTVVKGDRAIVHAGKGNIYKDSQHFSRDEMPNAADDNRGKTDMCPGGSEKSEDER